MLPSFTIDYVTLIYLDIFMYCKGDLKNRRKNHRNEQLDNLENIQLPGQIVRKINRVLAKYSDTDMPNSEH